MLGLIQQLKLYYVELEAFTIERHTSIANICHVQTWILGLDACDIVRRNEDIVKKKRKPHL